MDFRALRPEDRSWITACRDYRKNPFSALSFASLYTWRDAYGLTVTGGDDYYMVHSRHDGGYYCPCGAGEKCSAAVDMLSVGEKVLYLTETQAKALAGRGWAIQPRADLSEYIVSTEAEALVAGHISKSYKDKCHHFKRDVDYRVHVIGEKDQPVLQEMLHRCESEKIQQGFGDLGPLRTQIENMELLGLTGIILEAGNRHAFIMGYENSPDMFTTTMTKHDPELPTETTVICVHELALILYEKYCFLNLEEDLGLEGLRRAKKLYSPVSLLNVYEARKL